MPRELYKSPDKFILYKSTGVVPTIPTPATLRKYHTDFTDENLEIGEWARNIVDGKLFYRNQTAIETFDDELFGPAIYAYHEHDDRYFTETELAGDGTATVHWNNLTNIPAYGGGVGITGSPAATYMARWSAADTITGDANMVWDGTTLTILGNIVANGEISAFSGAAPGSWWDSMPVATDTTLGGIKVDGGGLTLTDGVLSITTGSGMVYPGAGIALSTGSAWGASITNNSANWNTAFGWGNHASAGYAAAGQTMYIGTTGVAINRASAALTLAGITLTTPNIGTPSAGTLTNCTFPTLNQSTTGSAATLTTARTIGGVSFNGSVNITVASATGGFTVSGGNLAIGANSITMTGSIGATGSRVTKGWFTDLEITNTPTINGVSIATTYAPLASPTFTGKVTTPALKVTTGAGAGKILVSDAAGDLAYLAAGATTTILVGGGAANPVWTTATGTGAPVRAGDPIFTTSFGFAVAKWRFVEDGTNILFKYNNVTKATLASDGSITFVGEVTAFG